MNTTPSNNEDLMRSFLFAVLFVLTLPLLPLFYLMCRLEAQPCPKCGEEWHTELIGEWGEEDWRCARCRHTWTVPY